MSNSDQELSQEGTSASELIPDIEEMGEEELNILFEEMAPPIRNYATLWRRMEASNIIQLYQDKEIVDLKNRLEENKEKAKDYVKRISEDYQKDLGIRDSLINQQQEEISSLQRDISSLQEKNSSLQEKNLSLEQTVSSHEQTISSLQQQNSNFLIRIESQQFLIDRRNDEMRQLSDDFLKMRDSLSEKIAVLQSEIIRLKK